MMKNSQIQNIAFDKQQKEHTFQHSLTYKNIFLISSLQNGTK